MPELKGVLRALAGYIDDRIPRDHPDGWVEMTASTLARYMANGRQYRLLEIEAHRIARRHGQPPLITGAERRDSGEDGQTTVYLEAEGGSGFWPLHPEGSVIVLEVDAWAT